MNDFQNELVEGEIHFRDNLQFELKSEFAINQNLKKNDFKQDFYIFIPKELQINPYTYPKEQFYLDETNFVRFKTPLFSLEKLIEEGHVDSPLYRLKKMVENRDEFDFDSMTEELQLFGNMFRTALRDQINKIIEKKDQLDSFLPTLKKVRNEFLSLQERYLTKYNDPNLKEQWKSIDEFISLMIEYYLTNLLRILREEKIAPEIDKKITDLIIEEQQYRNQEGFISNQGSHPNESLLYRLGLLKNFMLEALYLNTNRSSLEEKHGKLLGTLAGTIAMSIYVLLFAWKSPSFIINSTPFLFLAVFLYILRDRVKEELKTLFYKQAFKWFPDYSTIIKNRKGRVIGRLNENFSFVDESQVPKDILEIRNLNFREELPVIKRQETIMHYKREMILYPPPKEFKGRKTSITSIFRLNVHQFLEKANNPLQTNVRLDTQTLEIKELLLPRVYHINIIIQNTYIKSEKKEKIELKKFRVVVDKFGIKRVEQIK